MMLAPMLWVWTLHFLPLQITAAADSALFASPLYGSFQGGDPFDDGTTAVIPQVARLRSLRVCYGDAIEGIQLIYILQDGSTFIGTVHGKANKQQCPEDSKVSKIVFKENETLVRVEGLTQTKWKYISQLTFFTSMDGSPPTLRGGPFGRGNNSIDAPFSLTGEIRGIFGRSGDLLDAVGFYINTASLPLTSYRKTNIIGGKTGNDFDDFKILASNEGKPLKITNMVVSYASFVVGIQVTYMTSINGGTTTTLTHGTIVPADWMDNSATSALNFDTDEWITEVNISYISESFILSLTIETTDSKGVVRSYGPFGSGYVSPGNTTTIQGVVYGFYGYITSYQLSSLGCYVSS